MANSTVHGAEVNNHGSNGVNTRKTLVAPPVKGCFLNRNKYKVGDNHGVQFNDGYNTCGNDDKLVRGQEFLTFTIGKDYPCKSDEFQLNVKVDNYNKDVIDSSLICKNKSNGSSSDRDLKSVYSKAIAIAKANGLAKYLGQKRSPVPIIWDDAGATIFGVKGDTKLYELFSWNPSPGDEKRNNGKLFVGKDLTLNNKYLYSP